MTRLFGSSRVALAGAFLLSLSPVCPVHAEPPAAPAATPGIAAPTIAASDLSDPVKKETAMEIVCSAENSSLDWRAHYAYIEDIHDGRGYTAGIIGFCSGTGDMRHVVQWYTERVPDNRLAKYLPALRKLRGSDSHEGLDPDFVAAWMAAAAARSFKRRRRTSGIPSTSTPPSEWRRSMVSAHSVNLHTLTPP